MASRGAGRYLESFLELVASLWLSISPWRATAVQFMPIYVFFAFLRHQLSSKGNNQAGGIGWRVPGESAGLITVTAPLGTPSKNPSRQA